MSFTAEVKTELASLSYAECCARSELSALFHVGGFLELIDGGRRLSFQSTSNAVIRKMTRLIKDRYHIQTLLVSKKLTKFHHHDMFILSIDEMIDDIIKDLALIVNDEIIFHATKSEIYKKECCKKAYLRGAFLAGGSINSPETSSYHLEIQTFSEMQAHVLEEISKVFYLNGKVSKNKRGFIMYIKEAERIADFLKVIGATNSLFEFEDSRIKRDFTNSINRVINCDIANEKKALDAAAKQLGHIEIIETYAPNEVTKSMAEAIFLRKTYTDATLQELSILSTKHYEDEISKSALNHRFRAIKDLASRLIIEKESKR